SRQPDSPPHRQRCPSDSASRGRRPDRRARIGRMQLNYVIEFVADMDTAIAFYRDRLGLPLKFATPHWTEFATGQTTLALHPPSPENPAGKLQLGFGVPDIHQFYADAMAKGVEFVMPPTPEEFVTPPPSPH